MRLQKYFIANRFKDDIEVFKERTMHEFNNMPKTESFMKKISNDYSSDS